MELPLRQLKVPLDAEQFHVHGVAPDHRWIQFADTLRGGPRLLG